MDQGLVAPQEILRCRPPCPLPRSELTSRMAQFVLRRTAEINAKYLPPLAVYVAFCRPSALQVRGGVGVGQQQGLCWTSMSLCWTCMSKGAPCICQ